MSRHSLNVPHGRVKAFCAGLRRERGSAILPHRMDPNDQRIEKRDLRRPFENAMKPEPQWQVGLEIEKLGVRTPSGEALPYSGPVSIRTVHRYLIDRYQWQPIREGGEIIGLQRGASSITLEPGAQHELSMGPHRNLHQALQEFKEHLQELLSISRELGLAWLGFGIHPVTPLHKIEPIPKARYRIMSEYFKKSGLLGHIMMKQTAGVQTNLDYSNEEDACEKFRIGMALSPIVTAMVAHSPISEGKTNGYLSYRAQAWLHTDPTRCGLIREAFSESFGLDNYIDYALKAPMLFIEREGRLLATDAIPFGKYLEKGYEGWMPTLSDWDIHLSTLFPEVRFHPYVELRCTDSPPPSLTFAVPALWKGILYHRPSREAAWDLVKGGPWEERIALYHAVPKEGMKARIGGKTILSIAKELLKIAERGLQAQQETDEAGNDETIFLKPLMELVMEEEKSPAEKVLEQWNGPWQREIRPLLEHANLLQLIE